MMKDLSVLQEVPFTDHESIVEVFTDLSVWAGIRQVIERVNANAAAATHLPHLVRRISTWNYAVLLLPLFRGGVARRGSPLWPLGAWGHSAAEVRFATTTMRPFS